MPQTSPQLRPATPAWQTELAEALSEIVTKFKVSYTRLAQLAGGSTAGASKDLFFRLMSGQPHNAQTLKRLRPRLAMGLLAHLTANGLTRDEAVAHLSNAFTQEELNPMNVERTTLPPAACQHFALTGDPFTDSPKHRGEVWLSPDHEAIIKRAVQAIRKQQFIALLGEAGSGKSTLKKVLIERLAANEERFSHKLFWPKAVGVTRVSAANIERFLLESLGAKTSQDALTRTARLETLLEQNYVDGVRIALAIDECHRLTNETLLGLKDFYELGTGGFINYLGIILIGQNEFSTRLNDERHSPLKKRIEIIEMPRVESFAWDYAKHRLSLAGGNVEILFEKKALQLLAAQVKTPLDFGNLCNKALRLAHRDKESKVTETLLHKRLNLTREPRILNVKET